MVLAEVLYPPTNFERVETFNGKTDARKWIDHVISTDPGVQCYRNNCVIKITDLRTNTLNVHTMYLWFKASPS